MTRADFLVRDNRAGAPVQAPAAELAALAPEAAAEQGAFWEMHDQLLAHRDRLRMADLLSHAVRAAGARAKLAAS